MRLANHGRPSAFGPLAVGHAVERGDLANDFDAAGAGEAIPELIVGEWAGFFTEAAEFFGELATDQHPGEGRHGAFEKIARRVRKGRGRSGRGGGGQGGHGRAGDGARADGGKIFSEVWEDGGEIPRIERIVLVEHHDPSATRPAEGFVPIAHGAERGRVAVIEKFIGRKTGDGGGGLGEGAVVADDDFVIHGDGLRGETGEGFGEECGPIVSRHAEGDEWRGNHRGPASAVRTAEKTSATVSRRTQRFL